MNTLILIAYSNSCFNICQCNTGGKLLFLKDVHFLVSLILLGCFVGDLPTLYTNNECEISICEANYCFSSLRAIKKLNILFDAIDNNGLSR